MVRKTRFSYIRIFFVDVIGIECEIRKFKIFCRSNRLFDLGTVFTLGLVATRSSKLDPMFICFDDFFFDLKVTHL